MIILTFIVYSITTNNNHLLPYYSLWYVLCYSYLLFECIYVLLLLLLFIFICINFVLKFTYPFIDIHLKLLFVIHIQINNKPDKSLMLVPLMIGFKPISLTNGSALVIELHEHNIIHYNPLQIDINYNKQHILYNMQSVFKYLYINKYRL